MLDKHLEFLDSRIGRLPTQGYLCRTVLLATASLWALLAAVLLFLRKADRSEMGIRLTVIVGVVVALGSLAPPLSAAEYRSRKVAREFQREHQCPSTGRTSGHSIFPGCSARYDIAW